MIPARPIRSFPTRVHAIYDTQGIREICLRDPDDWELPPATPGAHIDLYLNNGLTRAYSLCGNPSATNEYRIAVKREPNGRGGSDYIHTTLQTGDTINVSLPRNTFPALKANGFYTLIAGGIGVTPFVPMLHELERLQAPYQLHLFYRDAPPLQHAFEHLRQPGNIVLHDRSKDQTTLHDLLQQRDHHHYAFCCGPATMINDFDAATAQWDADNVRKEFFVPPPVTLSKHAYTLKLNKSGKTIPVPAGVSALEALHNAGVPVQSSCEGGICGACKVPWLEGEPVHQDLYLNDTEKQQYIMTCVSGCASEYLVLDL